LRVPESVLPTEACADRLAAVMAALADRIHDGVEGSAALASMADLDLSVSQFRALITLHHAGRQLAIHELADALGLSLAAAGRCVDRLVDLNLAARSVDPNDRRIKRVRLAAAGRAVIDGLAVEQSAAFRAFAGRLSRDHRHRLAEVIADILQVLPADRPVGACLPLASAKENRS
jgi:DNA-binding MarR family transcriptional regulator